jgi:hypothetical protein
MGLSTDPEKRERQLANLQKGWAKNAERLATEPAPRNKPLEVLDRASAAPKPGRKAAPKPKPRQPRKPPRAAAREPAREPARGGGLWDELKAGLLGG